jgi:outer membrane protein assembly factor BamA
MSAAAALALALAASARAATTTTVSTGPVVSAIRIERTNVFDPLVPGEDWWPFRMADKIHVNTREKIVRDELLFKPGDQLTPLKALESERNLRANYPFRRAEITQTPNPDGTVDALVRTQDSWSLNPKIGIGTSGGQSTASYGIEENNLLGYGKSISYGHSQGNSTSGPQHSDSFGYGDPRFLGTRLGLGGSYTRNQDGSSYGVSLARPFYSLDTPAAVSASWNLSNAVGTEERDAVDYSKYFERRRVVDAAYGVRLDDDRWFVQRVETGWYEDKADFSPTTVAPGTLPGTQPADRHLSGPTVGYSWIQPDYIKETYIDRMERVEDFNLGNELRVRTGYMARGTGSDQDRWIFNASDAQGLRLGDQRFALASVGVSGRVFNSKWENGLATASANFYWKNYFWSRGRTLIVHTEAVEGRRLDLENQVLLGGSNGLRGYKNNSFVGGRALLANAEDRFFFEREWFHLVRFGGAVFIESGSVVPEGGAFSVARFHSDFGAGLRAASTRSTSGGVVRFDVAYALNGGPGGGSRFVISLRGGQAFGFGASSAHVTTSPSSGL